MFSIPAFAKSIEWGTAGEWFGGIATAAAFLYALRLGSGRTTADRRRQAERVAVWFEPSDKSKFIESKRPYIGPYGSFAIANASDQPIIDVTVTTAKYDENGEYEVGRRPIGTVLPRNAHFDEVSNEIHAEDPRLYAEFTDAAGRIWQRDVGGHLVEIRPHKRALWLSQIWSRVWSRTPHP